MYLDNKNEQSQIRLAQTTNDMEIIKQLSQSIYMPVRRSVAKNPSIPNNILEILCSDSSLNVSFIANNICKNEKIKRKMISTHPCVICDVDEKEYYNTCKTCTKVLNIY